METRELRYFVAVAEELHFGRAAQRLGIAQPPLSRAIRQLERRLGAPLLDRTGRTVTLTEAGAVLLQEGRAALEAVEAAERRARRAARGRPAVVLVTKAGASRELLAELLDAYAAEADAATVDVLLCGPGEQERLLRDGRADVALLHTPFDTTAGLDTEELRTEEQVVVLPAAHPLATRSQLRTAEVTELPGLPLPRWPGRDGTYPDGPGPKVRDHAQLLQLIALGRASAILPESCRARLGDDLAAVPLADAPSVTTVIAWPPHSRSAAVAGLVRTATSRARAEAAAAVVDDRGCSPARRQQPRTPAAGAPTSSAAGALITETLDYDGGREVTAYLPAQPPEAVVFAGDGQLVSRWGADLDTAGVPPTLIVGVHRPADETQRLHEYSPPLDPHCFAAHEHFFVDDVHRWVSSRFGVALPRGRTAVLGVSAGAELALALGVRHPDRYGTVLGASPGAGYRPPATLPSPLPRTYLVAGTEEPFFRDNATRWAAALRAAGADVVLTERAGAHGDPFWRHEFPLMLRWAFGPRSPRRHSP